MTTLPSVYTALESLLLFQALRAEGCKNAPFSFNRISNQLNSIPSIRNDPSYDEDRLSADLLRDCYLRLVKDEVKKDRERQSEEVQSAANGDATPPSRKRKASSPTLPTVQEAAQWPHLIPQLVERLYTTYRDHTVKELRLYERQYDELSRDIADIESGKWDERPQNKRPSPAAQSPKPSIAAHTQPALDRPENGPPAPPIVSGLRSPQRSLEVSAPPPNKPYSTAKIDAVMNHGPEPQYNQGSHRRKSSNTTLPPLSEMAPQSPRFGIPPKLPGSMAAQVQHLQQQSPGHGYAHSPPTGHHSPYAAHHAHPIASPQLHNPLSRPSSSPRLILPPPPGMQLPPPTPIQHTVAQSLRGPHMPPQQHYSPQHRPSIGPSPIGGGLPHGYQQQLPLPHPPPGYYPQQPYADRRTSYAAPQGQPIPSYPAQPPLRGGYQHQPFVLDGSQPGKVQQRHSLAQQQQHTPRPPPAQSIVHPSRPPAYPQYPSAPTTALRPPIQRPSRLVSDIIAALATPPRPLRKPLWKSERRPPPLNSPAPTPAPEIEPLSPILRRVKLPQESSDRDVEYNAPPRERRATIHTAHATHRDASLQGQRDRAGDATPPTTHDTALRRTRSPSIRPNAGTSLSIDTRPSSRSSVKIEPSTPADATDHSERAPEPSATPASRPTTRKRRGTVQSQTQPPSKRKRQQSPSAHEESAETADTPPPRSTTINATRNFAKMAATVMNDITSHKHASYFAGKVREKDANGYSTIIKQPQNLKSIRTAITAGTRAIAAATTTLESPAETPTMSTTKAADGSMIVELERTADLIPPKAIVNAAQLEKEVYRMFANAMMFNPGEDGLVSYTREMFNDVEAKIRDWRGAERDVGAEEEEDGGKGKRRKP